MGLAEFKSQVALIYQLFRRDLSERYQGTVLGFAWLLIQPLFMLGLYTLVFSGVLQIRFNAQASNSNFALYVFTGLLVFNAFSEVLTRSTSLLTERRELLLNTALPSWALPIVPVAVSVALEILSLLVLVCALILTQKFQLLGLILYLPFLLIRIVFSLAAAYSLAVLGVFLRDLRQLVPALLTVLLFISPILYPLELIPESLRPLYQWNPLAQLVEAYREALLQGTVTLGRLGALLVVSSSSLLVAVLLFRQLMPRARYVL
ncbi:MAG TPA: ABC transporter permease [Thiolinea sp.]|nr:ABC transporter permease [Thiolinea sp.]